MVSLPVITESTTYHGYVVSDAMVTTSVMVTWIYIAPSRETCKALRHGSHSFTCKLHHASLFLS